MVHEKLFITRLKRLYISPKVSQNFIFKKFNKNGFNDFDTIGSVQFLYS